MGNIDMLSEIERCIAFQRKWRRIMSFSHYTCASLNIISSIIASVVAGMGKAEIAAIIAAIAAASAGLEKTLLFYARWSHHRSVETQLEKVRREYIVHSLDDNAVAKKINEIMEFYNVKMPMPIETSVP